MKARKPGKKAMKMDKKNHFQIMNRQISPSQTNQRILLLNLSTLIEIYRVLFNLQIRIIHAGKLGRKREQRLGVEQVQS